MKLWKDITALWEKMKNSKFQGVSFDGDIGMSDDGYISDKHYYPYRITFSDEKYELLMAEGIFKNGTFPVDYNPSENISRDGDEYQF